MITTDELTRLLDQKKTKEEIYLEFLQAGKKVDQIEKAFAELAASSQHHPENRFVQTLVIIGAVLVGLGILSLVAANWGKFPGIFRIGGCLISMLAAYAFGITLINKYQMNKTGKALMLLGSLIFGATIFLIAQIYNISADWYNGFFYWASGVLVVAALLNFYSQYVLGLLISVVGLGGIYFDMMFSLRYTPSLANASYVLVAFSIITFVIATSHSRVFPPDEREYY